MSLSNIQLEQKVVAVYSLLAVLSGYLSNLLSYNSLYSFATPLIVYGITLAVSTKMVKKNKAKSLVSNSLITFVLVWLVVWTFLYNI